MSNPEDILQRPPAAPDASYAYGDGPSQVADIFLPSALHAPMPVLIAIHGGFWRKQYDRHHLSNLCRALAIGRAVVSLEYRKLGETGGGWPGTFDDVAGAATHLSQIAGKHSLDLSRVAITGHSAGGQLALWLAARIAQARHSAPALTIKGVVALAAVSDLAYGAELHLSNGVVAELLGGDPAAVPDRYRLASPAQLVPLGVKQRIVHGTLDDIVPFEMSQRYVNAARKAGDDAVLERIEGAGHFELIDPESSAWPVVRDAVSGLIG